MSASFEEFIEICSLVEEQANIWDYPIVYNGHNVTKGFSFPQNETLDEIRMNLCLSGVYVRSESQRETNTSKGVCRRVHLKCSNSYRKRPSIVRKRKTSTMTVESPNENCHFSISLKQKHGEAWVVVSLESRHTHHPQLEFSEGFIHHINLLSADQIDLFKSLIRSNCKSSSVRKFFNDRNLHVTSQFIRNLKRKLLPEMDTSEESYLTPYIGDPSYRSSESLSQSMKHLLELQFNNCPFVVRWEIYCPDTFSKMGEVSVVKTPGQPPIQSDQFTTSFLDMYLASVGVTSSKPLPGSEYDYIVALSSQSTSSQSLSSSSSTVVSGEGGSIEEEEEEEEKESSIILSNTSIHLQALGSEWCDLLQNDGRMFLFGGCYWCRSISEMKYPHLFPEVCMMDTTPNCNANNNPIMFFTGIDSEDKTQNWMYGVLPNQRRTTFLWLMCVVVPIFLGMRTIEAIQAIITDGDRQMGDAISHAIKQYNYGKGEAYHQLCYWHTINLYLKTEVGKLGGERLQTVEDLLYSISECEDSSGFQRKWNELEEYVNTFSPDHLREATLEALSVILSKAPKWARVYFPKIRNFGEKTSGRCETENLHHKDDSAVHSRSEMKSNIKAVNLRMQNREIQRTEDIRLSAKRPLPLDASLQSSIQDADGCPLWFRDKLTRFGSSQLSDQWIAADSYSVKVQSPNICVVQYCPSYGVNVEHYGDDEGEMNSTSTSSASSTSQWKERIVQVIEPLSQIVCSCNYVAIHALPCRHILAVVKKLEIPFSANSVHLRWHKSYLRGTFIKHYHRTPKDGFRGIPFKGNFPYFPKVDVVPMPSNEVEQISDHDINEEPSEDEVKEVLDPHGKEEESDSDDSDYEDDGQFSPSCSPESPPYSPERERKSSSSSSSHGDVYQMVSQAFDAFKGRVLERSTHSQQTAEWSLRFISKMEDSFDTQYVEEFLANRGTLFLDSTFPSDLPMTKKRALYSFEKRGKIHKNKSTNQATQFYDRLPPMPTRRRIAFEKEEEEEFYSSQSQRMSIDESTSSQLETPPLQLVTPPLLLETPSLQIDTPPCDVDVSEMDEDNE
jgi:hypothetical protein